MTVLPKQIKRRTAPSKLDHGEYGMRCVVDIDEIYYDLYIQLGSDEADPNWEYMGKFRNDEKITVDPQMPSSD